MEQLLEIKTVPIIIKCSVNREPVEKKDLTADVEISKNDDGFAMRCRSISVDMDSYANTDTFTGGNYNQQENNYNANAIFNRDGEISVDYKKILDQTAQHKVSSIPKRDFNIDDIHVQYEMDKASIDRKISESAICFTPANLEITIEQRPEVIIKYIGGPIYVPPSSDPDYEPEIDVKA